MLENETSLILLYSPPCCFLLAPKGCSEASQKQLAPREWLVGKKRIQRKTMAVFPPREVPLSPHLCRSDLLAAYMILQSRLPRNVLKDLTAYAAFSWSRHTPPVFLSLTETER